ncbi:isochorismatase family protein [Gorillibacterium sp. sgz5001074]|uniref:isochorismatase family protein n=1 Tax=Gorillibacterium sp. sgz5001074 TaxID=3446695 RepID=UPI003F670EAC
MALPRIQPYPMPDASDLPGNRVEWRPDPGRAVLLIHDMQHYFVRAFPQGQSPVTELITHIQALKRHCTELGIPVVYSAQPGGQTPEQRGLLMDFWGPGIQEGPEEQAIVEELEPSGDDIRLTKWRYSAFHHTKLQEIMSEQKRDQLIICGIYGHIGCLMTACDAFMKDIQAFFVADAVADFSLENHRMAIRYAAERCAVTATTRQMLEWLSAAGESADLTPEEVRSQVAAMLGVAPWSLDESENLAHLGLDSVRMMSLAEKWRRSGRDITFVELAEAPTLEAWLKQLFAQPVLALPNTDYL